MITTEMLQTRNAFVFPSHHIFCFISSSHIPCHISSIIQSVTRQLPIFLPLSPHPLPTPVTFTHDISSHLSSCQIYHFLPSSFFQSLLIRFHVTKPLFLCQTSNLTPSHLSQDSTQSDNTTSTQLWHSVSFCLGSLPTGAIVQLVFVVHLNQI